MKISTSNGNLALKEDSSISIERVNPFFNDDSGSFSLPLPIPKIPNEKLLGYPGRTTRINQIGNIGFYLEHAGLNIINGVIDFDGTSKKEIGIILKSEKQAFDQIMDKVLLSSIPFDQIVFPAVGENVMDHGFGQALIDSNNVDNGKFVCYPFRSDTRLVNIVQGLTCELGMIAESQTAYDIHRPYCLQFKIKYIIEKIFESVGYTMLDYNLTGTYFDRLLVFGKIFMLITQNEQINGVQDLGDIVSKPDYDYLNFADLMPEMEVKKFLAVIESMGVLFDINDSKKTVSVRLISEPFSAPAIASYSNRAVNDYEHFEDLEVTGLQLTYMDQEDSLASRGGYEIFAEVASYANLPATNDSNYYNMIVRTTDTGRDYQLTETSDAVYTWERIGRLPAITFGTIDEDAEDISLDFHAPVSRVFIFDEFGSNPTTVELPTIDKKIENAQYNDIPLTMMLYWPKQTVGSISWPFLSAEKFSVDGAIEFQYNLTPDEIYNLAYKEYFYWLLFVKKRADKFLKLSLREALKLQWDEPYIIEGTPFFLDKVLFEIPYKGIVKVECFVARMEDYEEEITFGPPPPNLIM